MADTPTPLNRMDRLRELVREFPQSPGVYLMKNAQGKIVYVGKAKSLRSRVRSYLTDSKDHTPKTRHLVASIEVIDFMLTNTEVEAFLLEATLIKKNRPRYNIRLRDDKAYPYLKVTVQQDFPRFYLSRRVTRDGSLYFGPFMRGGDVFETIRFLNRTFQIRDCTDSFMKSRKRPCLTHQIGRCTAPCVALVNKEDYRKDIDAAVLFLRGGGKKLIKDLTKKMKTASGEERFERAAQLRDSLRALDAILSQQSVIEENIEMDQDVVGFFGDERGMIIEVVHIRGGRFMSSQPQEFPKLDIGEGSHDDREWLLSFLNQYYADNIVPDEVLLPMDLGNDLSKLLRAVLEERRGSPVRVRYPTDQNSSKLLELAERNARESFKEQMSKNEKRLRGLDEIQKRFQLPRIPRRIECFDISNFQGAESVASQVVFENATPAKEHYRLYKIKTVEGSNDFASMKEVLGRRFRHTEYEDPDLIVIDGGKGQLRMAVEILTEMGLEQLPVVGLAKARTQGEFHSSDVHSSEERFFLPGRQNPITFPPNSEALHILAGIRDEAHRFAITYHRKLREDRTLESELDAIVGLGEKRKKALLKAFDSVEKIRIAEVEDIAKVAGMNRVLAERVLLALNETDEVTDSGIESSV